MRHPLLLIALLLAAPPLRAADSPELPPMPGEPVERAGTPGPSRFPAQPEVIPTEAMSARLLQAGWRAARDGSLERVDGRPPIIHKVLLLRADFVWEKGVLCYSSTRRPIEDDKLGPVLDGLSLFAKAMAENRAEVGRALARWGLPQVFDGRRLIEADGNATYLGIMLYQVYSSDPGAAKRLSTERLSQSLTLFESAFSQAFMHESPDIAQRDLQRAWVILTAQLRPGESALRRAPYPDPGAQLSRYREQFEKEVRAAEAAHDAARSGDARVSLAALNALERQHVGPALPEMPVPAPGSPAQVPGSSLRDPPLREAPDPSDSAHAGLASSLPTVLRTLERINGGPLTTQQQETLIKSFPMGELVWSMGAQEFWRKGLTGRGVRVAVVDEGVESHPELDDSVFSRQNFTQQRGGASVGAHGTHVAGIIHALAPDAQLRSYAALPGGAFGGNPRQNSPPKDAVVSAIEAAVRDGNQIVNLSLGGYGDLSDSVVRAVERFSAQGVIFVVAAGNSGEAMGGVAAPAVAPSAITVGNIDASGRMNRSSSYGVNWDPSAMAYAGKTLFMAPGTNILSTVGGAFGAPVGYRAMTGTSMASPATAGVTALLLDSVGSYSPLPNPVSAAIAVKQALTHSGRTMSINSLPQEFPLDQPVIVVDPLAALNALQRQMPPPASVVKR